jgi:hypothetical protein
MRKVKVKTMTTFRDFYHTPEFNNFTDFLRDTYKAKLVLSPFESFIIIRDREYIHEIKFDIDFDGRQDIESTYIINLCLLIDELRKLNKDVRSNYFTKDLQVKKLLKVVKLFNKQLVNKTSDEEVTYVKRNRFYRTAEIIDHEERIKTYEMYPA